MANLADNIRLNTEVNLQGFIDLTKQLSQIQLSLAAVASAARDSANVQKEQINSVLNAEKTAETERNARSERRRLNKIANVQAETQAELNAIKVADAASRAAYSQQIRNINLYNAQLKNKSQETNNAQKASDGLFSVLTSLTGIRSQLIGLFGAFSVGSFAQQMVEAQSKVESFGLSMKNLLGREYGNKLVEDLKKFTVETPLNFEQVIKSSSQLVGSFKAAGASSETIGREIPIILESLGNSAAALGGENRLGRLIYAFSQVQATGRLMGTEVRQITETGFPLLAVMSQQTGKSVQELQKDIKDGKVSFEMFQKAILSAGKEGGIFAGSMEIMANTVQGRIDKLKESTFFALANIGNQFNDIAKSVIDFGSNLLKSLFGTEEATKKTINYVQALSTLAASFYLSRVANAAWVSIQQVSLILKGRAILQNIALTGSYNVLTAAETEAAAAATAFNASTKANPIGIVIGLLGVAYAAYQLYSSQIDEAKEFTLQNVKANDSEVKGLISKQAQLNATAKSVLGLAEGTEGYKLQIGQLIKKYPEYFGNLDAETASHEDVRKALFFANNEMVRKIKLMAQEKLATKVADKVADVKLQIAEEQIANQQRLDNEKAYQAKQIELKKKGFQDEYTEQLGAELLSQNSKKQSNDKLNKLIAQDNQYNLLLQKVSDDYTLTLREDYQVRKDAIIKKWQNKEFETKKQFTDAIIALDKEFGYRSNENTNKIAEEGGKSGKEIALKYKTDTDKQKAILDQANALRAEQKTRENQQKILDLEKEYDELRVNNAKGSQTIKVKELQKIENKYREDSANLTREYDKKDIESREKWVDFSKGIDKALADIEENKLKRAEKDSEKLKKLDEDNAKETIKLEEDKYKLMDKLRILQAISKAKNSKEIIDIQNKENESILRENQASIEKQIFAEKMKLAKMALLKKENTEEYKTQEGIILKLEQEITRLKIELAKFLTEKKSDELEEQAKKEKKAFEFTLKVADAFLDALNSSFDESMSKTTDVVTKAQLENQKAIVGIAKQGISAISSIADSLVKGDILSAVFTGISFIYNSVKTLGQNTERLNAAILEKATNELNDYLSVVEKGVDKLLSRLDDIREAYGDIKVGTGTIRTTLSDDLGLDAAMKNLWNLSSSVKSLSESILNIPAFDFGNLLGVNTSLDSWRLIIELSGRSVDELIQAEITRGQQIQKTYETAVSKENELYAKRKESIDKTYQDTLKSIDDAYNAQVASINKIYDYESIKSSQKYNKETLDITAAGSAQLEALITNEASLSSVRAEFAAKRLQIEQAFPLASKAITADMSEAEIKAINDSIKARDEQLAKLQGWYNDELTFIVNSEGQKRKEYTATETIQKTIRENLELAAIVFAGKEIEREKQKNIAIAAAGAKKIKDEKEAEAVRDADRITAKSDNDAALLALENKKNADIATSFKILTELLKIYSEDITKAMEDTTAKGSDAYKKLAQELNAVNDLLKQIKTNSGTNPITIPINGLNTIGFEKGTDDTSVALKGQRVVDNKGGWQAILHPQEAVFSKADMTQMETVFGKRPTRQEVIENFKIGVVNQVTPQMNPFVIQKVQANGIGNFDKLSGEIRSLAKEVSKKMSPVVYVDKGGIRTYYKNLNSQIEVKNQRFK